MRSREHHPARGVRSTAAGLLGAALTALAACTPSPAPPVSLGGGAMPPDPRGPAPSDAGPPPPGRCPQDAPWNGRVCLGQGYVACPGDARLDDAGACQALPREARDAGR